MKPSCITVTITVCHRLIHEKKKIAWKLLTVPLLWYSPHPFTSPDPNPVFPSFAVFYTDRSGKAASNPLLDQLPSYQSLLYRRKPSTSNAKWRGTSRNRLGSSGSGKWALSTITRHEEKQKTLQRPVRELPKTMAEKRSDK